MEINRALASLAQFPMAIKILLFLACALAAFGEGLAAVAVSVETDPPHPSANILPDGYCDFAYGKVFSKEKKSVYRNVGRIVKPGRSYILSCEIKPTAEVAVNPWNTWGLGCSLAFWTKDWKKAVSLEARGDGPEKWRRVVSKKVTIPDWIVHGQLTVGVAYSKGGGEVRNIELTEADCELVVKASADKGIAQVKIVDENLVTLFDSGVLSGEETTWSKRFEATPVLGYTAYVVDREGDVAFGESRKSEKKTQR